MAGVEIAELGVAPSAADLLSLTDDEAVSVMRVAQRQKNAADAVRLAAIAEVAVRQGDADLPVRRMAVPDRWAADEVRAGLALSLHSANDLVDFAWIVTHRLPALHTAMARGDLDEGRARVLARWTKDLSDEHAALVVEDVLPRCSIDCPNPYTAEALAERCKKLGIALDPDWALRMFTEALKRRRVIGWRNEDGTADLAAQHQDPTRVAGGLGRIKRLAAAARRAGDHRPLDHLRSELALGMLDGTYASPNDDEILRLLATTRSAEVPEPQAEAAGNAHTAVHITVKLSTLLDLDRHPADLAGWGPVHAEHARDLVQKLTSGQWRFAILDAEGRPIRSGLTSARPRGWARRKSDDAGVVDLLVSAELLASLTEGPLQHGNLVEPAAVFAWLPVIEDIARRADGSALGNSGAGPSGGPDPSDARRRFPRAGLRRELQLAMRTCVGVGCRHPSTQSEMDHTLDHALGGDTVRENLGPACDHDHDLKSKGGWRLKRLDDHTFRWTSRLGRTYVRKVAPLVEDLPSPGPAPSPSGPDVPDRYVDADPWLGYLKPRRPGP